MRRIDWKSKRPALDKLLGKMSGPAIAKRLDVSVTALRWYCQNNGISLLLDGQTRQSPPKKRVRKINPEAALNKSLEKVRAMKQTARMIAADSPVKLGVDIEKLWKIPRRCFHQTHMGSFTQ